MATETEIAQILVVLAASYPRFELKKETVAAYVEFLHDLPADELRMAARDCAVSKDFFPSVHELRQAVAEMHREKMGVPSAFDAWQEVCGHPKDGLSRRVLENAGGWVIEESVMSWSHPLVERVAVQMGWPRFPTSEEIGVDRAHFFKAYDYAVGQALKENVRLPEVAAYIGASNSAMKLGDGL